MISGALPSNQHAWIVFINILIQFTGVPIVLIRFQLWLLDYNDVNLSVTTGNVKFTLVIVLDRISTKQDSKAITIHDEGVLCVKELKIRNFAYEQE